MSQSERTRKAALHTQLQSQDFSSESEVRRSTGEIHLSCAEVRKCQDIQSP
ncbi:hypothetical protein FKM82_016723 [Ascaphus truei]